MYQAKAHFIDHLVRSFVGEEEKPKKPLTVGQAFSRMGI